MTTGLVCLRGKKEEEKEEGETGEERERQKQKESQIRDVPLRYVPAGATAMSNF